MTIRNLQSLFQPRSVAVIGASQRPNSVGATLMHNLTTGSFKGPLFAVNPKYGEVAGVKAYSSLAKLPQAPDLALICTPPATIVRLIADLGARGTKAAIIFSAGLNRVGDPEKKAMLQQAMLAAAKPYLLRLLGPDCTGLLVPSLGLNASVALGDALPGQLAFVSQSGALATGVLDWARSRGIGFSKFLSLGDSADIDVGDVLDYLASDASTRAILLHVQDIGGARKFMSAARAAARNKPVLMIKARRAADGAWDPSAAGSQFGADEVYDCAIRRAGMLRVFSTGDLFSAVETLAHARPVAGERLTILGNGAGPGVMAADALLAGQGQLAVPSAETVQRLDAVLPAGWSGANPLDILADATVEHYRQSLEQALVDPQADAVLMIHAPSAFVASTEVAQALAPMARQTSRTLLSCWLGGAALAPARAIFADASVPVYDTPEEAVRGFMQLVQYRRNQALLMQVPPSVPVDFTPDRASARAVVQDALNAGRNLLTAAESNAVLAAYRIAVADTCLAASVDEVVAASEKMGFPVALKIVSPDIAHKGEVGGVALDLDSPEAVRVAALAMQSRLLAWRPDARLQGFSIQVMTRRPAALELRAGIRIDPVFGPVLRFGQGGGAADLPHDHALALPPLNMPLARDLVARTRVSALLAGSSERPAVDEDAICRMLIQLAHLAADLPELTDLDINPFLADSDGIIVLDARIRIAEAAGGEHLAIRPYPKELEQAIDWHDGELLLRPIRPEDARPYATFFDALDRKDVRYRMFIGMRELQPSQLARMTQIDYDRELAFLAIRPLADGTHEILAEARVVFDPDNQEAEFALIVRSDLKDRGLGEIMMKKLIGCCRQRGTVRIAGEAMSDNQRMLKLARRLGFTVARLDDPSTMSMRLELTTSM